MTSSDRILQYIEYKGLSKREFYLKTGLSNGFLDKTSNVGTDKLEKILSAFPDINLMYVVAGQGEVVIPADVQHPPPAVELVLGEQNEPYQQIPPDVKSKKTKESVSPTVSPTPDYGVSKIYLTPQYITVDNQGEENILHISARAAAGYLSGHNNPVYLQQQPTFRLPGLTDASYRSFQVDGDSMNPTLLNGEMVIGRWVEKIDYIRDDRVHILVTKNDGVIIKRLLNRVEQYNKVIAKSDATNDRNLYQNIEVAPEDILEIWYAVFHGGFNFQSPADMWKRVNNHEADITILQSTVNQLANVIKAAGLLKE